MTPLETLLIAAWLGLVAFAIYKTMEFITHRIIDFFWKDE